MKIHVVGGDNLTETMFQKNGHSIVEKPVDADVLCFTGGADVNPALYGEEPHPKTHFSLARDEYDELIYSQHKDKPKVGICRGAQFLNVMSGGKLHQHVNGHATGNTHLAVDVRTGDGHQVTSTHHQVIRLAPKANLLMVAQLAYFDDRMASSLGVEAVWYEHTRSLCFQPHPEYNHKPTEEIFMEYFNEFITD